WRPSISARRCRRAPAVYPQVSGGQPSNDLRSRSSRTDLL
ncbi:MAG: hypothetical protein AVDCRST_MAG54-464, partial [uncultured Actinomycetospora sp.]